MRNTFLMTTSLLSLLTLTACETTSTSEWDRDCQRNFSTTSRELSQCKQKVADMQSATIKQGEVSIDPENAVRESFDDLGKGGASDSN